MRLGPLVALVAITAAAAAPCREALTAPPSVAVADVGAQTDAAFAELERAAAATGPEKAEHARRAREMLVACHATSPSWRTAGGLALAEVALGHSAAASGWYWLATDASDYSEGYLAWQRQALGAIFEGRAAVTLDLSRPAKTVHVDEVELPAGAFDRALALDPGEHAVRVTGVDGGAGAGVVTVAKSEVGARRFAKVEVHPRGWVDPAEAGPVTAPRPPQDGGGLGALQIVTIVGTVALATGIAVGGGYLLFGRDNPRGLDSAEGAVVITTELVLIGAGTAIALISD